MQRLIGLTLLIGLATAGCQRDATQPMPANHVRTESPAVPGPKVVKIKVSAAGTISADGQPTTLERLATALAELKQAGGQVWYYRDNPGGPPPPNAMEVLKLVVENKLPIKLSAKEDFSDHLDERGLSRPDR